jgi:hypothetical protein
MPVPFHTVLREHLSTRQPNSERALLEHRARIAFANERAHRRRARRRQMRGSARDAGLTIARVRVACVIGLLVMALGALASKASAMPGSWPRESPRVTVASASSGGRAGYMRSGGGQFAGRLGDTHATRVTGGRGQPGLAKPVTPGSGHHYTGQQLRPRAVIQSSRTFDWADASVGAGFTVALALLAAGGALVLSRRRAHRPMTAGNRY